MFCSLLLEWHAQLEPLPRQALDVVASSLRFLARSTGNRVIQFDFEQLHRLGSCQRFPHISIVKAAKYRVARSCGPKTI